ncbi:MAG TPA: ferritin-like domain-containing protein [Solirubrobacteraceae bacterium]
MDGVLAEPTHGSVELDGVRTTRRDALARWLRPVGAAGVVAGAGAAGATVAFARGSSALTRRDREVLGFLAGLERLESSFYAAALSAGKLTGEPRQFAQTVGREERSHLRDLVDLLGGHGPFAGHHRFDRAVASNASFVAAAATLEDTVVAAYNGQAENVTRRTLARIARIMSVESRHAAWARGLAGTLPAPVAADAAMDADAAMKALRPLVGGRS